MYTYLEVVSPTETKIYYVHVHVNKGLLSIRQLNGILKSWAIKIPIAELQTLFVRDSYWGSVIQFNYHGKQFNLLENGMGMQAYLSKRAVLA